MNAVTSVVALECLLDDGERRLVAMLLPEAGVVHTSGIQRWTLRQPAMRRPSRAEYRLNVRAVSDGEVLAHQVLVAVTAAAARAHQPGKNDARFSSEVCQREFTPQTGLGLSRSEVQLLLTTDKFDLAKGNRKRKPKISWHPEWMLLEAAGLGQVVERLDDPEEGFTVRFDQSSIVVPVLLSLAIEIALKALQWNERDGRQPAQTHDLLLLFKGLKKDTRERIEANMPEVPGMFLEQLHRPGIRTALSRARRVFVDWRYPYEHPGLIVDTADLQTALKAILDVHPVRVIRGPTLGNQQHRQ